MTGHRHAKVHHSCDDASTVSTSSISSDDAVYHRSSCLNSTKLHPLVDSVSSNLTASDKDADTCEDEARSSTSTSTSTATVPLSSRAFPQTGRPCLRLSYDYCTYDSKEGVSRHRISPSDNAKEITRRLKMKLAQAKSNADTQISFTRQLSQANMSLKTENKVCKEKIRSLQLAVTEHEGTERERDELRAENKRLSAEMEQVLFERNKLKNQLGIMTVDFPADGNKAEEGHQAKATSFLSMMTSAARLSSERVHLSPDDFLWADDQPSPGTVDATYVTIPKSQQTTTLDETSVLINEKIGEALANESYEARSCNSSPTQKMNNECEGMKEDFEARLNSQQEMIAKLQIELDLEMEMKSNMEAEFNEVKEEYETTLALQQEMIAMLQIELDVEKEIKEINNESQRDEGRK